MTRVLGTGLSGIIAHAAKRPCIICGGNPVGVGLYVAEGEAARRVGAPQEMPARAIPYSLCQAHPPDDENSERAARLLEASIAVEPPTIFLVSELKGITFFDGSDDR